MQKIELNNGVSFQIGKDTQTGEPCIICTDSTGATCDVEEMDFLHKFRELSNKLTFIVWTIDDVKQECPGLTDEHALEVLQSLPDEHDANIGVNWDTIRYAAAALYPTEA